VESASEGSPSVLTEARLKWHFDSMGILRSAPPTAYASLRMTLLKKYCLKEKFVEVEAACSLAKRQKKRSHGNYFHGILRELYILKLRNELINFYQRRVLL